MFPAGLTNLLQHVESALDLVENDKPLKFSFIRLGKLCNASRGVSFTDAVCDFDVIKYIDRYNEVNVPSVDFDKLFSKGFTFLRQLINKETIWTELKDHEKEAVNLLQMFIEEKDMHSQSLNKIIRKECNSKPSETDLTAAFAEHLLGKLSPGRSYIVDTRVKKKSKSCPCGLDYCKKDIKYGPTGIGHEEVWHGFLDIILSSDSGIPGSSLAANVTPTESEDVADSELTNVLDSDSSTPAKRMRMDGDHKTKDESPGGRNITEVKVLPHGVQDQTIAEAIVFSMIQKSRHPLFENHLVPTIAISSKDFRIIMYDAEKDVLICSNGRKFIDPEYGLMVPSVLIIWMVLHYRMFCVCLKNKEKLESLKANFIEFAEDKLGVYLKNLKYFAPDFPVIKREVPVDYLLDNYAKKVEVC